MNNKIEEAKIIICKQLKDKKEPISFKEIVSNCQDEGISRASCWRARNELMRDKIIENDPSLTNGRGACYYSVENKKVILEHIVKKRNNLAEKNTIENISSEFTESRRRHDDELKEQVLQPMRNWLPKINDLEISFPKGLSPVKNKVLFDDFKNHLIPEFGNPFSQYEKFSEIKKDFIITKSNLRDYIVKNILEKQMELEPFYYKSHEQRVTDGIEKDARDDMTFFNKEGSFSYDIFGTTDKIMDIISWWQFENFDEKEFDYIYRNPISRVEDKNNCHDYHCCLDWDMPFVFIEKSSWHKTEEDLLKLMDKKVMTILNEVKTSDYLRSGILKLQKNKKQLVEVINNMETSLNKYYHFHGLLPGNCEYCP